MIKHIFLIIIGSLFATLLFSGTSHAYTFDAGRIIDDSIFTNKSSMTATQIQDFLNAKVPNCDTNGTKPSEYGGGTRAQWGIANGYAPPYICLKDYKENNKTAAKIIYDTAQEFSINPQVLLVLLQKEQALVLDEWPVSIQYRSATGYGCPDTAACDTTYYGFTNQVTWAARMFRAIMDNSPTWYTPYILGKNYIQYNPNVSCGGSNVVIENRATQALYNYTPYQPNQAALNAGWGTATCGAYGNRNFWLYFTTWFGNTNIPTVFRTQDSPKAYLLSGNGYYHIPNYETLLSYGYNKSSITFVKNSSISSLKNLGTLNTLATFDKKTYYLIDSGNKIEFDSDATIASYSLAKNKASILDQSLLYSFKNGGIISRVVVDKSNNYKYFIENNKKRHIINNKAYTTLGSPIYSTLPKTILSPWHIEKIPSGPPILASGLFVLDSDTMDYGYWNGSEVINVHDTIFSKVVKYAYKHEKISELPKSNKRTILEQFSYNGNYFIVDNKVTYRISDSIAKYIGIKSTDYPSIDSYFIDGIKESLKDFIPITRVNGSDEIYQIKDGERNHLRSRLAIKDIGYSIEESMDISLEMSKKFPDSNKSIFEHGKLLRINNGSKVFLINNAGSKLYIPSRKIMNEFGFSFSDVGNHTPQEVSSYTTKGSLDSTFIKSTSNIYYIIDNGGKKRKIPTTLYNDFIKGKSIINLSDQTLKRFKLKESITPVVRIYNKDPVYKIENGKKIWITSRNDLFAAGFDFSDVIPLSEFTVNSFR